jgi:hypothetical protein
VDVKNLPAPLFAAFWVFYTIYNALNNLTIPPIIGFMLAIVALYFYPLHGERLKGVKKALL